MEAPLGGSSPVVAIEAGIKNLKFEYTEQDANVVQMRKAHFQEKMATDLGTVVLNALTELICIVWDSVMLIFDALKSLIYFDLDYLSARAFEVIRDGEAFLGHCLLAIGFLEVGSLFVTDASSHRFMYSEFLHHKSEKFNQKQTNLDVQKPITDENASLEDGSDALLGPQRKKEQDLSTSLDDYTCFIPEVSDWCITKLEDGFSRIFLADKDATDLIEQENKNINKILHFYFTSLIVNNPKNDATGPSIDLNVVKNRISEILNENVENYRSRLGAAFKEYSNLTQSVNELKMDFEAKYTEKWEVKDLLDSIQDGATYNVVEKHCLEKKDISLQFKAFNKYTEILMHKDLTEAQKEVINDAANRVRVSMVKYYYELSGDINEALACIKEISSRDEQDRALEWIIEFLLSQGYFSSALLVTQELSVEKQDKFLLLISQDATVLEKYPATASQALSKIHEIDDSVRTQLLANLNLQSV